MEVSVWPEVRFCRAIFGGGRSVDAITFSTREERLRLKECNHCVGPPLTVALD